MENPLRVAVLDQARSFAQQTMRKSIIWTAAKQSSTGVKHDRGWIWGCLERRDDEMTRPVANNPARSVAGDVRQAANIP